MTAEQFFESNLNTYCTNGQVPDEQVKRAAQSAILEFASFHCYQLLTELIDCKFGHGNAEGVKYRYEWLRDNMK